jgi:hypothetical protein
MQMQVAPHDADAMLINPDDKLARQRPFDSAYNTFSRMKNCVFSTVPTKTYRAQPTLSSCRRMARICISSDSRLATSGENQLSS